MVLQVLAACVALCEPDTNSHFSENLKSVQLILKENDRLDGDASIARSCWDASHQYTVLKDDLIWQVQDEGIRFSLNPKSGSLLQILDEQSASGQRRPVSGQEMGLADIKLSAKKWLEMLGVKGSIVFSQEPGAPSSRSPMMSTATCSLLAYQQFGGFVSREPIRIKVSRDKGQLESVQFVVEPIVEHRADEAVVNREAAEAAVLSAYSTYKPYDRASIRYLGSRLGFPTFYSASDFTEEHRLLYKRKVAVPMHSFVLVNLDLRGADGIYHHTQIFDVDARTGRVLTVNHMKPVPLLGAGVPKQGATLDGHPFAAGDSWPVAMDGVEGSLSLSEQGWPPAQDGEREVVVDSGGILVKCEFDDNGMYFRIGDRKSYCVLSENLRSAAIRQLKAVSPFHPR